MRIVIPSKDDKLCGHFGHCDYFSFVEVDSSTNEIKSIESRIPEGGVSCASAGWISGEGADVILAGGMGGGPLQTFAQNGIRVVAGCPELPISDVVVRFLNNTLTVGENSCGREGHHHCHSHGEHHCGHHN